MTAPQSSRRLGLTSTSFASILYDLLMDSGCDVSWQDAQGTWTIDDLAKYDAVILGIAPILSLSANKAYSILSLIDTLKDDKRLLLFIDAPEPAKVYASLKSASKDYNTRLFKPFYSKRKDYNTEAIASKVATAIEHLLSKKWPTILCPMLPWDTNQSISNNLPEVMSTSIVGVHVDACYLLGGAQLATNSRRAMHWTAESPRSAWTVDVAKNLMYPHIAIKTGKISSDTVSINAISNGIGMLFSPHGDKKTWWSPRVRQALYTLTPVVTEWRLAGAIGSAWTHLAAGIEEMSHIDRYELAVVQREQYNNSLPKMKDVAMQVLKEAGITSNVNIPI